MNFMKFMKKFLTENLRIIKKNVKYSTSLKHSLFFSIFSSSLKFKKITFILVSVIFYSKVSAYSGIMAGEKNIKIAKTQFFDIIYSEDSSASANVLFEKADELYAEIAYIFNLKNPFRMPVVISPAQDEFNAYFSFAPFNHIVMYDTAPSENMAVFSQTLLMTFRHELTHAITYNLKNNFWYAIGKLFGDSYNPGTLTITTAWSEGAAVSIESSSGEGRLNDDYSLHSIRQAKIENCLPKYSEINGTRDIYPYTRQSYNFGGSFNAWLQEKYGMEKYAEFWHKCVNFKTLTYFSCFKKVYKIPIEKAWTEFLDSIKIPDINSNPEKEEWCVSFKYADKKSGYSSLCTSEKGFGYFDSYSGKVFFTDLSNAPNIYEAKPRFLFRRNGITKLNFCYGGRFAAVSYVSLKGKMPKNKTAVYDMKYKRFFYLNEASLRDCTIFKIEDKYYAAAVKTKSQFSALHIYELEMNRKGKIKAAVLKKEIKNEFGEIIFSLSSGSSGYLYYILKSGPKQSICRIKPFDENPEVYNLPKDKMVIRNLSVLSGNFLEKKGTEKIAFSFTESGTLPRLGFAEFNESDLTFTLQADDISGGIYSPVFIKDNTAAYIAKFYEGSKIFYADIEKMNFCEKTTGSKAENYFLTDAKNSFHSYPVDKKAKKFSLPAYQFSNLKGTLLPAGITKSYFIDESKTEIESIPLQSGITYITASPWSMPVFIVSAGYDYFTKSGAAKINLLGSVPSGLFNYNFSGQAEFDEFGYKQSFISVNQNTRIPITRNFYWNLEDEFTLFEGRQNHFLDSKGSYIKILNFLTDKVITNTENKVHNFFASNKFYSSIGNIRKSGPGFYEYSGMQLTALYGASFFKNFSKPKDYTFYQNVSLGILTKLPYIFPAKNYNYTYNFPLTLEAVLFPKKNYLCIGSAETVLFSKELQASSVFLPLLYFNRFSFTLGYLGKFKNNLEGFSAVLANKDNLENIFNSKIKYYDELSLKSELILTPNIGGFANPLAKFGLSAILKYRIFPEPEEKKLSFSLGGLLEF